jgi:predicted lipid-binding transport protein (Tim44 family)
MKRKLAAIALAIALVPVGAHAQERVGDAALGALSGAVVLGPIGAVGGALIGFTAGPNIANAWGVRRSRRATYRRPPRQASQVSQPARSGDIGSRQGAPVQARTAESQAAPSAVDVAVSPQGAPAAAAAPPSAAAAPGGGGMVPVQGFE